MAITAPDINIQYETMTISKYMDGNKVEDIDILTAFKSLRLYI